jgi:hypothetical protein
MPTEENAERCVPERREVLRDFSFRALALEGKFLGA